MNLTNTARTTSTSSWRMERANMTAPSPANTTALPAATRYLLYPFLNKTLNIRYDPSLVRGQLVSWTSIMFVMSIVGALTSGALLLVIFSQKKLRSGCGMLIGHLIVNCFIMCSIHFPINAIFVYGSNFWFVLPSGICSSVYYLQSVTVYVANWTDACLALNRFVAIVFPFHYSRWIAPKNSFIMIGFCWVISLVTLLPFSFGIGGHFFLSPGVGQCTLMPTERTSFVFLGLSTYGPYIVVGLVVLTVLGRIIHGHGHANAKVGIEAGTTEQALVRQQQLQAKRLRVGLMLFLNFLFSVLCNLPLFVTLAFARTLFAAHPLLPSWLRLCLATQYTCTPWIFFALNQDYRDGFRHLLRGRSADDQSLGNSVSLNGVVGVPVSKEEQLGPLTVKYQSHECSNFEKPV